MKKFLPLFIIFLSFNSELVSQYIPSSQYLINPDLAIGYTDSCAAFWIQTWDDQTGGFYTNIDKSGNVITAWGTNKNMLTQSRNAYGLVRAYMLTGNTLYLNFAAKALSWMYSHAWDSVNGGWYQELNSSGNPVSPTNEKTAFYQHYALLGIAAYYEATHDSSAREWLMKGYQHLENYFWDVRPLYSGYYDRVSYNNQNPSGKSFNATVDAITTHLLYLYLMTKNDIYKERLLEIAREIKEHLAASMPQQMIGFVEEYDSDWNWNNSSTMTIMGHVLKAGWCLARINQLFPDTSYINTAEILINNVWQKGYDHVYGGPYKDFNRITGEMLLWGLGDSAKAWWQMEQAIVSGLMMHYSTGESWYLQMADETLNFYMQYFFDRQNGEVYADRTRRGGFAWNEAKGNSGKAGYHSIETGYYTYLYGNLFYKHQPVVLNYNILPVSYEREILLTPLAIRDSSLMLTKVLLDGEEYTNYDPSSRILNLPSGIGGSFEVTFGTSVTEVNEAPPISEFHLSQNYPNPFNPSTTIEYSIGSKEYVSLKIFDLLGSEVESLVNEEKSAGSYTVTWKPSNIASGIYFYRLQAGSVSKTRKMILVR